MFKVAYNSRYLLFRNLARNFSTSQNKVFIETAELQELIQKAPGSLTIIDASLPKPDFQPKLEHIKERIPGSIIFDITEIRDHLNIVPLMLPPQEQFAFFMKTLDIRKSD